METTMSNIHTDNAISDTDTQQESATSRRFGRPGDDVVRWGEFQLALWMGAFALTAILGGFTFLYTAITDVQAAISDLRVEMEAQHGEMRDEIRAEMQAEHAEIRAEMQADHAEIRAEIRAEADTLRGETDILRGEIGTLRDDVIDVRERVIRIEIHLGTAAGPADTPEA